MFEKEILYERNLTGSYMKIPVAADGSFDEKIMLKRKLPGLLALEKCYVNGDGQYWYNISGKQSLDTYCRVKQLESDFVERIIISICNEIEILERNLLDVNSLMLDPELIYISNRTEEVIFTIYPGLSTCLSDEFRMLMEFLITRVDHSDPTAVRVAYGLYEKSMEDTCSVIDLRDEIISRKEEEAISRRKEDEEKRPEERKAPGSRKPLVEERKAPRLRKPPAEERKALGSRKSPAEVTVPGEDKGGGKQLLNQLWTKTLEILRYKPGENNKAEWVMPNEEFEEVYHSKKAPSYNVNPTICLSEYGKAAKGMLKYQGADELEDIKLDKEINNIGQCPDVEVAINRETISHFHAKIEKLADGSYYIEDLNSTNGTSVNGMALSYKEKKKLNINDRISFADIEYRFL